MIDNDLLYEKLCSRGTIIGEHGCWMAPDYQYRDYLVVNLRNVGGRAAHRVSYIKFNGEIPAGLQIDHLCYNRSCYNPEHLEAVTASENIKRAFKFYREGGKPLNKNATHGLALVKGWY